MTSNAMITVEPPSSEPRRVDRNAEFGEQTRCSELSASLLHARALECFRIGNQARRQFLRALQKIAESRLYFELGFPNIAAYAEHYFGYHKSETYEALRVSEAFETLHGTERAFTDGDLRWSTVKSIVRIATPATEESWVDYARGKSVRVVRDEVDHALATGRDRPREGSVGLPDLKVRTTIEMQRSEHEVFRRAIDRIIASMRPADPGSGDAKPRAVDRIELKDALLFLSEKILSGELELGREGALGGKGAEDGPKGPGAGSGPTGRTLLYHVCPRCRRGAMETMEGRVEVDPGVIDAIEEAPGTVTIDLGAGVVTGTPPGTEEEGGPAEEWSVELDPEEGDAERSLEKEASSGDSTVGDHRPADSASERKSIDRPNPPSLRRKVRLRDGDRCRNPSCEAPADHCHHVRWRQDHGSTVIDNEVALCARCHGLIHAGLLKLTGSPATGLRWVPRAQEWGRGNAAGAGAGTPTAKKDRRGSSPRQDEVSARAESKSAVEESSSPSPPETPPPATEASPSGSEPPGGGLSDSARAESERRAIILPQRLRRPPITPRSPDDSARAESSAALIQGLVRLGYSLKEAKARLAAAVARLRECGEPWDEGRALEEALRGGVR